MTIKTPERVAEAQRLREQGVLLREIGDRLGVSMKTVHTWLADPDLERHYARRRTYARPCIDCGAPTDGSNGRGPNAAQRCGKCNAAVFADCAAVRQISQALPRRERLAELYLAGVPLKAIAAEFGIRVTSVGAMLTSMRSSGWDLPHRYPEARCKAMLEGRRRAAASSRNRPASSSGSDVARFPTKQRRSDGT